MDLFSKAQGSAEVPLKVGKTGPGFIPDILDAGKLHFHSKIYIPSSALGLE